MWKLVVGSALIGLLGSVAVARAEIGTVDAVPAATLLLPYFEVDLSSTGSTTTLLSINNASATAVLAHVTLWTDQSVPTFNFDVYLTGYDVQSINLRDIFNGTLPTTASDGQDPTDTANPADGISSQGPLSQDINFASCTSILPPPTLSSAITTRLRTAHRGAAVADFGGECAGANYGDNVVRGYVTVDTVNACNTLFPSSAGYDSFITFQNVLWGDYLYVNPVQRFAQGNMLVHVEACIPGNGYIGYVGNGAGKCPFTPGAYTFYGRYASVAGLDQREPLATTFDSRFVNGGAFTSGTDLIVWRDAKTVPTGTNGTRDCGSAGPAWFPLPQNDVVAFDEQENPTDLCSSDTCFPLEAGRYDTRNGSLFSDLSVPSPFGFLYVNLNHSGASAGLPPNSAQAWVTTLMDTNGRYSVGFHAFPQDNASSVIPDGGRVLIP